MIHALLKRELSKKTAMITVLLGSSIWGFLWMPLRAIEAAGMGGIWASLYYTIMPIPILGVIYGPVLLRDRRHWRVYFIAGGAIGAGFMLYIIGLIVGSVTKTTLIFYLTPVWSTLMGMAFLGEKNRPVLWLGNALGLTGCAMIMGISPGSLSIEPVDLLGLVAGVLWSVGTVAIRRYPEADIGGITLMQYILGSVVAVLGIIAVGEATPSVDVLLRATPVAFIASTVVFMPVFLLICRIAQYVSPAIIGILMLSEVFFAILTAYLLLDEPMIFSQWIGAGLIILTALLVTMAEARDNDA
ncbi:DMT family transporter [Alphaproteobacteria bacterium LSUCC0684]